MSKYLNKVVIITGGAYGIGKSAVGAFAAQGARVIIWDIDQECGEKAEKEFTSQGLKVIFQKVDTTRLEDVMQAAALVDEKYHSIDVLINNAGITKDATQLNMTNEQWQGVIDTNLTGVFNCTQAVSPFMIKNNYGRIINASSLVGIYGNTGQNNYSATKSGLVSITKVWARELSKYGITVNAITPGFIETESVKDVPSNVLQSIKDKIPVGRLGKADDIAAAYLFLASTEASYISGSVLSVDGGYVA